MAGKRTAVDRRAFLFKSGSFLLSSLFGLNMFSKALALEGIESDCSHQPRIALIIDDIGPSFSRARQFLELKVPITFSILPHLRNSHDLALEIHDSGHEIMLHQPMEPHNPNLDPGPGTLYVGFGAERITRVMEENIASLSLAVGVNNHMGSRFTECGSKMKDTLGVIKDNGLFFIDSLTTSSSTGYKTARKLRMIAASRNVFLDNVPDASAIIRQLDKLKRYALKYGCAIGIGHPLPETAGSIREFVKGLEDSGIRLEHVSNILCN